MWLLLLLQFFLFLMATGVAVLYNLLNCHCVIRLLFLTWFWVHTDQTKKVKRGGFKCHTQYKIQSKEPFYGHWIQTENRNL